MASNFQPGTNDLGQGLGGLTTDQQRELLAKLLREKASRKTHFPMSVGQQGLWYGFRRDPNDTSFNVFLPTRIRSAINLEAFRKAVECVARRHASIRTTFSDKAGQLSQTVHSDLLPEFRVVDMLGASDESLQEAVGKAAREPFDLREGPLSRIRLYRVADDDWIVLALTHHIVIDFWSLVMILQETREAYAHFANSLALRWEDPVNNYHQFVSEQQKLLASQSGAQLASYWRSCIDGASPVVDLVTDLNRPATFSGRAAACELQIPRELLPRIHDFARRCGGTVFSVVQSAIQVLIHRYSGQASFLIGTPFSGRCHRKYERTVGFFINMLPIRAELNSDPTFAELVAGTAEQLFAALENEAYPIANIVRDASIPRDPSRSPLFQVSCTFEKSQLVEEQGRAGFLFPGEQHSWSFGGLKQESFYVPHPTCHYDVEFIFEQSDDKLRGMICYCRDLFLPESIHKLAENFVQLLTQLLDDGLSPISSVPWGSLQTGCEESPKLLESHAAAEPAMAAAQPRVEQLIGNSIDRNPDRLAFRMGQYSLRYRDLDEISRLIARRLIETGVGKGSIVPVIAHRDPAVFAAMQAIHRIGSAFVPIDAHHASIDLRRLLEETRAAVVVAQDYVNLSEALDVPVIRFESLVARQTEAGPQATNRAAAEDHRGHAAASAAEGRSGLAASGMASAAMSLESRGAGPQSFSDSLADEHLAYLVYTSGSTGAPKGVMVEHAAVCNTLQWRQRAVPLNFNDRVLLLLSHQFDAGLGVAWTALTQGAQVVWASDYEVRDPDLLMELIISEGITVLPAPPSLLSVLIAHPRFQECADGLSQIWTGGEAMPADLPARIRQLTKARFLNFYGPTEASIESTFFDATEHPADRPVPIGRAIDHTQLLILDTRHRIVPDTVPGELAIAGRGLALGYWNDPELTRKRFIPHPQNADGNQRVYLTGDRARRNAFGEIEFLGRLDAQVKLRGYRIELGEIEALLESHYLIARAAVKILQNGTSQARMVAFVSTATGGKPTGDDDSGLGKQRHTQKLNATLRRFLGENLPKYKVPSVVIHVDNMPLTSSGKVDRARLPETVDPALLVQEVVQPSTALESYLASSWCKMLELSQVSVQQNFFDAGGSSLQAAVLTTQLSDELGVPVPTALLFDLADIKQLATRLVELYPQAMTAKFGADCVESQLRQSQENNAPSELEHPLIAPLKPSGSRRPLFMVHPPGGIVVCYRELASQLSADQPLFGIRSRGLHGSEEMPSTLEHMARDYLDAVKSVQAEGPYVLGGWSLGGLVAYEMAQQLRNTGSEVSQLILLDTTIHQGASCAVPADELVTLGVEYGIEMSLEQLAELAPDDQLPFLWDHATKLGLVDADAPQEVIARVLEDLQSLFHHHVALAKAYRMLPTDVPITLFRPTETPMELKVSKDRGWSYLSPSVEVRFVPGHHHSMVQTPHVAELAKQLQAALS